MIDGGIDRGKSGFFSGVDDAVFEGGIFFDGFDRLDCNEGRVISLVGGGDSIKQFFDFLGGLGKVLGVDDFVTYNGVFISSYIVFANIIFFVPTACLAMSHMFS
jgi:hypothetical protein